MDVLRRRFLLSIGALGFGQLHPQPVLAADSLRIATTPLDAAAEPYYAQEMGFFRDHGIDASVDSLASGAVIANAVLSGAYDVGFAAVVAVAVAHQKGLPLTVIAPASLYLASDPTSVLMVPKNSPAKTARDLNGKTLGASLGTMSQYAPQAWMEKNGADPSSLKMIELSQPAIVAALAAGRIDGAIVAEPFVTQAMANARILANAFDAVGPRIAIGVWFAHRSWAQAHADLVSRFALSMQSSALWANKNHARSAAILARVGKLDPNVATTMRRVVYPETLVASELQPVIDLTARFGGIPATFAAEDLVFHP